MQQIGKQPINSYLMKKFQSCPAFAAQVFWMLQPLFQLLLPTLCRSIHGFIHMMRMLNYQEIFPILSLINPQLSHIIKLLTLPLKNKKEFFFQNGIYLINNCKIFFLIFLFFQAFDYCFVYYLFSALINYYYSVIYQEIYQILFS